MSKRTHSRKRSHTKKSPKQKPSRVLKRKYEWRTKLLAGAIAATLLAGGTFAHWRARHDEVLTAKNTPNPVKNISTASEHDLADIPPAAFQPQPPIAAGYNAYSGGLPPGALPPGVRSPGMLMMQGGRTTELRQQFTGKERDTETGLDYFGARYYSSAQGRFTSPDEVQSSSEGFALLGNGDPVKQALPSANLTNPQSLNKYQYALNNPLRYVDPNGQSPQDSLELNTNRDIKDLLEHRITEQEFRDRQTARGMGAVVGAAIVALAIAGPEAATAILMWAARNPETTNQIAEETVQASSGNPAPSAAGLTTAEVGLVREARVAEITGGQIVRRSIVVENVGRSEVDVVSKAGDYIVVGGPAKAINLSRLGKQLDILKRKAAEDGVKALAYFEKGTPESALKVARRRLGADNVHIFE